MSGRNQYMRDYYKAHKEAILAQRKRRYANDPEYRAKQNEMRRKSRKRRALFDHKEDYSSSAPKGKPMRVNVKGESMIVEMYTVAQFCRHVGLQRPRLSKWFQAGWLNRPSYTNSQGHLLYTQYEFEGLTKLVRSHRMSQAAKGYKFKADPALKEAVAAFYADMDKGIPNNIDEDTEEE